MNHLLMSFSRKGSSLPEPDVPGGVGETLHEPSALGFVIRIRYRRPAISKGPAQLTLTADDQTFPPHHGHPKDARRAAGGALLYLRSRWPLGSVVRGLAHRTSPAWAT